VDAGWPDSASDSYLGALDVLAYADILSHTGVGEIAAGLGLGPSARDGAIVQGRPSSRFSGGCGTPLFYDFNLLLLNEFRNAADLTGGRKNLVMFWPERAP
jgi:hypothetical protein